MMDREVREEVSVMDKRRMRGDWRKVERLCLSLSLMMEEGQSCSTAQRV